MCHASGVLPLLLLVFLGAVPSPARALRVAAGGLGVEAARDPWGLVFVDAAGRVVLAEHPGRDTGPSGTLGFRTATGWAHATRVTGQRRAGRKLALTLETTDPGGRRLAARLAPRAEGVLLLEARVEGGPHPDIEALGMGFVAGPGERFLGFGERANALDQRGQVVESYVADGPYQPEERPVVGVFVPAPGFRARDDATYFPMPWLLSSRGYGVLVDGFETAYHRLATDRPDAWSVEIVGAPEGMGPRPAPEALRLLVFAGPRPADVLRRLTAHVGRQPPAAAPWVLGPWFQPGGALADRVAQLRKLRTADAPVSVAQTYTHYLPCGDHVGRRDAERAQTESLHAEGVAVTTYFNPMICEAYEPRFSEAAGAGALARAPDGGSYRYRYTGTEFFFVGQFDFAARAGARLYHELLAEAVDDGYDGWMEDFGEYTPLDARAADGATGAALHNRYPVEYHCAAFDFTRRQRRPVARFQRSGWTGAARCAQVVWNGDPSTDWGFDGLTSAVWGGLGMGLSGVSLWGSDIGGFFAFGERALTGELLLRWVQLGAVSGVMRTQRNGFAIPLGKIRPQVEDDDQLPNWRRHAKLRTQLYPYLSAADAEYRRTGVPIMRHHVLTWPEDTAAVARDLEFLLGPDLLAAPVTTSGATSRALYLPPGLWVDFWRSVRLDGEGAPQLEPAVLHPGGQEVTLPAPPDELPLLVRAGAILPLLPADVDTLADYGDPASGLVRLRERRTELVLLAFPRGRSEARFHARGRLRAEERSGSWTLVIRGDRTRRYTLRASLGTLARPFVPCALAWRGRRLPDSVWGYDPGTQALEARLAGGSGRLVVRAACAG